MNQDGQDELVGTAVRSSASFPFFSPAVTIRPSLDHNSSDAGYYSNYGVSLTGSWLFQQPE